MATGLVSPYLKTTRAEEHLGHLRQAIYDFCQTNPCSLIGEEDVKNGLYRVSVKSTDPPERISLIAGDLFYCLRSALDQLVWSLAKLSLPYPEHTQFPIFDRLNKETKRRFSQYTEGVPTAAVRIVDELQPHYRSDRAAIESHLLWQLNFLCNLDKHTRIPVWGMVSDFYNVAPSALMPFVTFKNTDEMSEMVVPLERKDQVNLNPRATVTVMFGDYSKGIAYDAIAIGRIYGFVTNDVLPRFARFFQ